MVEPFSREIGHSFEGTLGEVKSAATVQGVQLDLRLAWPPRCDLRPFYWLKVTELKVTGMSWE